MWRNFKIRTKMMLGFALILLVFAISVTVTWSLMQTVSEGNQFIVDKAVPGQALVTRIDEASYEILLAMRSLQYLETPEAAEAAKKTRADAQKVMDDITALYTRAPDIKSIAYMVENVFPLLKNYFGTIDQTLGGITEKKDAFGRLGVYGAEASKVGAEMRQYLFDQAELSIQGGNVAEQRRRLDMIDRLDSIMLRLETVRRGALAAMLTFNYDNLAVAFQGVPPIVKAIDELRDMMNTPENRRRADALKASIDGYAEAQVDFLGDYKTLDGIDAARTALRNQVNAGTTQTILLSEERLRELSTTALADLNTSITILIISAAVSILLGVITAFIISRSIARPLSTIVDLAERAGNGDLTIQPEDFHYSGKDELGHLVDALSTMVASQEDAMKHVVSVSVNLADSSSNLSAISAETNASMEEVKNSIDQVATLSESNGAALQECNAGVEEMSAGADTVAQSATDSAAFISQTTDASNRAIQTVNKVINGMREVDANSKESEEKIKQLVASVENVSSFVSVITGIADQTNLLALNAAIEAARAGEVGRGFAVVAEEVRKLAEESARAAQNVNGIIVELQSGAHESIKATTNAGRMLSETLVHAEQAQGELNSALQEMSKANDSIQNIAAVAEEQAASCKEVATAIDSATKSTMDMVETVSEIRRATDETSQASQGVAAQSEAMNGHASELSEVLSHFKLTGGSHDSAPKPKDAHPKALTARKR